MSKSNKSKKPAAKKSTKKAPPVAKAPAAPTDDMGFPLTYDLTDETAVETAEAATTEPIAFAPETTTEPTLPAVEPVATPEVTAADPLAETDDFPTSLNAFLLIYDIPSSSNYPNPSAKLRRIGFRENKSCWVIPEGAVPHHLIQEMRTEGGANVELIRFDAGEGPRLCRMAIDRMRRDVEEQIARTRESIASAARKNIDRVDADAELNDNVSEREAALDVYERRCYWSIRCLEKMVEDSEVAIKNFGLKPELLSMADTRNLIATLQTGYKEQSKAYVAATEALRAVQTVDAQALANLAAKDAVPAEPMADALREAGNEAAADELQTAFSK